MSKLKFTPVSTGMLVGCLILFPIALTLLNSGYQAMRYYRNYSAALNFYNAGELVEALDALDRASETNPENVYHKLLEAKVLMEQGKISGANAIYKEIQEDSWVAKQGSVICDFYELEKKKTAKEELYWELEKRLKNLSQESEGSPDPQICRAHIHLKVAQMYLKKDKEKFLRYIENAKKILKKVFKNIQEFPPSRSSCHSLYIAQGMIHYLQAKVNLEGKPIRPKSEEAKQTGNDLHQAILNYRRAYLYRFNTKSVPHNIDNLYTTLLGSYWLDTNKRQEILLETSDYIKKERAKFVGYLQFLGKRQEVAKWGFATTANLYAAMMLGYYLNNDFKNANDVYTYARNASDAVTIYYNHLQMETNKVTLSYPNHNPKVSGAVYKQAESNFKRLGDAKKFLKPNMTKQDFITINNYVGATYYHLPQKLPGRVEVLKKSWRFVPGYVRFERIGKKSVTARAVVFNNLYYLYKKMDNEAEARKWAKYRLP